MTHPIVVTGATGAVGRQVIDGLLASGRAVRAVSRRPEAAGLPAGVEVSPGELDRALHARRRDQGGFAADNADFLFGFESYDGTPGVIDEPHDTRVDPDDVHRTLADITGSPARTFAQWARDHATDFAA